MNRFRAALETALDVLETTGIPYAISGTLAAVHHGYLRATEDLDIQVAIDDTTELEAAAEHLPPDVRRIDVRTWRFPGDVDVKLHEVRDQLDERSTATRVEGTVPGEDGRTAWFVGLEPLLVLKIREHVRQDRSLKHVGDVRKLIARNHDRLDVDALEELLALDPAWAAAWDEMVESG